MLRVPLWPVRVADSIPIASSRARAIPILDLHELAAGKLAALFARTASRDVFDAQALLARDDLDDTKLRLAFVVYGGINRRDWRSIEIDEIRADPVGFERSLVPMLRHDASPKPGAIEAWSHGLVGQCRKGLERLLPLSRREIEFLEALNDGGEIQPELLTDDAELRERIAGHPGLQWKALNVRRQSGDEHKRPDAPSD